MAADDEVLGLVSQVLARAEVGKGSDDLLVSWVKVRGHRQANQARSNRIPAEVTHGH